jgi:hypothetical protein
LGLCEKAVRGAAKGSVGVLRAPSTSFGFSRPSVCCVGLALVGW